jgi:YVTN family beta-propeller protein
MALLHNPAVGKVYSANSGDYYSPATLTVIDAENDSVLKTLATGAPEEPSSRDLCLNTVNSRVYASSYEEGKVAVIDPVADTIVAEVAVDYPSVLCYNPGYNYVYAATGLSKVGVIDCGPNTLIATVAVSASPAALCYVPAGAKVYTANRSHGSVSVIAGSTPGVVADIDVGSAPSALCWNSRENKVYCANRTDGEVAVIDASADTVITYVAVGNEPVALSYDLLNDYVYCTCRASNDVYVIDAHRDSVVATIDVGAEPFALAWDPIEYRTYVLNYANSSVSVLRDSLHVGLADGQPQAASLKPQATVLRGVLMLDAVGSRQKTGYRAELLDISGRKVMDLKPGANDVRALAPGVYFVSELRTTNQGLRTTTKVVITR